MNPMSLNSAKGKSSLVDKILAVVAKDIRSEFRTRYAINAIVMFAVVTVIAVSFATGGAGLETNLQSVILWLVIYFSSVAALGQCFIKEEENRTSLALRIYTPHYAVFGGKYIFNLILLAVLELIVIPLFSGFIGLEITNFGLFITIVILSTIGLAGATTIIAAIISKASIKGVLFAVLSFPLILPLLIMAIRGTQKSLTDGAVFLDGLPEIKFMVSYAVVMTVAGALLFEYVWNE
jgi:heme exporter protein B